jgi:hypothetical protein
MQANLWFTKFLTGLKGSDNALEAIIVPIAGIEVGPGTS